MKTAHALAQGGKFDSTKNKGSQKWKVYRMNSYGPQEETV